MSHIHTSKGQHDNTVGAYIVRKSDDELKVLLHMHSKLHRLLPVGGHIELLETPWQAIAHELEEESGYTLNDLELMQPYERLKSLSDVVLHPYPVVLSTHDVTEAHNHTDIAYAFWAIDLPTKSIGIGESSDLRWLTQYELNALNSTEIFENTREIYNFILDVCTNNWEKVSTREYHI